MSEGLATVRLFGPRARAYRRFKKMQHGVITTARLVADSMKGYRFDALMVTLTYKARTAEAYSVKDVSAYIELLRKWYKRNHPQVPLRYVWVLEDQQDGTPHYHVIVWVPKGLKLPMPDKTGMWTHGMTRIEKAKHSVGYLAHYAAKLAKHNSDIFRASKVLPKGARIWSRGGLTETQRRIFRWWRLPSYLRDEYSSTDDLRPAAALSPPDFAPPPPHKWTTKDGHLHENKRQRLPSLGGFISKATGQHIPARYKVVYAPDDVKWSCYDWTEKPVKKSFVVAIVHVDELDAYLADNIRYDTSADEKTYDDNH